MILCEGKGKLKLKRQVHDTMISSITVQDVDIVYQIKDAMVVESNTIISKIDAFKDNKSE